MHWRLRARDYEARKGAGNRTGLYERVHGDGPPPGLLAYVEGEPAGWCSVGPRAEFVRLLTSRILAPVDEEPVWSIVCFFVDRAHRGRGLSVALIDAAVAFAGRHDARVVEAYPVEPKLDAMPPVFAFTGIASAFRQAGFREVERRSPTRPIMRRATESERHPV